MRREPGWIARADRESLTLAGRAVLPDNREVPVTINNLSRHGCEVKSAETLRIGDAVRLEIEGMLAIAATIRWSMFGTAGVRFLGEDWG
ncbi:MAG TPA: PilZ domain-containing protein [Sphingomicrobium sp.]